MIAHPASPNIADKVPSIDAKDPIKRIEAIKALDASKPVPSVIAATKLFGDSDPAVAKEARATAVRLIGKKQRTK